MAVVRKSSSRSRKVTAAAQSASTIKKKPSDKTVSVTTTTQPKTLREMNDVSFGTLDAQKDGFLVIYNRTSDKMQLISADSILETASADNDLPDTFIQQLDTELNLEFGDFDGGGFVE
jgi:hypothetical protein